MERRHTAAGSRVRVGSVFDQQVDHRRLSPWVPFARPGRVHHRRVKGLGTAPVLGAYLGATLDEDEREAGVIGACRHMEERVALVQLSVAFGAEELVTPAESSVNQIG